MAKGKKEDEEEITEMTPEVIERLAAKANAQRMGGEAAEGGTEKEKPKGGLLGGLFKKKETKDAPAEATKQQAAGAQTQDTSQPQEKEEKPDEPEARDKATEALGVEIERIKATMDAIREEKKAGDSNIATAFESIGELRSMIFEADTSVKEVAAKLDRLEESVSFLKPQELERELREKKDALEKHEMRFEKLETQTKDMAEKLNSAYNLLKGLGNFENLVNLDKGTGVKVSEIKELVKYVEKLSSKVEKHYLDISKYVEEFGNYKARQESFEESFNDLVKAVDALNLKLDDFSTKKDTEGVKSDITIIQKAIEEVKKILPLVEVKLPETIIKLKAEKQDIEALLSTMEEQYLAGKVSRSDYTSVKRNNEERLREIQNDLDKQWEIVRKVIENPEDVAAKVDAVAAREQRTESPEEKTGANEKAKPSEVTKTEESKTEDAVGKKKEGTVDGSGKKGVEKFDIGSLVTRMKGVPAEPEAKEDGKRTVEAKAEKPDEAKKMKKPDTDEKSEEEVEEAKDTRGAEKKAEDGARPAAGMEKLDIGSLVNKMRGKA